MYHTCVFARLAIYGHSDHETDITVEFTSKNGYWRCTTLVCLPDLPYMVTLIMKLTSPLNSCWKMVPENVSHLCVCWTYHIWSLWSWNWHHHWIHIEKWFMKMYHTCVFAGLAIYGHSDHGMDHHWIHVKKWFPKMYHTCVFARLAIYGHSDHKTDITIEFTLKNGSWRCITHVCLPDLSYMVTLIMKLTSPLSSHWKMVLKDVSCLCVCWTCHIWSLQSWNGQTDITHWKLL